MFKNKANSIKRAEGFLDEILKDGYLYHLIYPSQDNSEKFSLEDFFVTDSHEFANSETEEPLQIMPFWSETYLPYAKHFANNELEVEKMTLEAFTQTILPIMRDSFTILGLNWDGGGAGLEIDPDSLTEQLIDKIEKQNNN